MTDNRHETPNDQFSTYLPELIANPDNFKRTLRSIRSGADRKVFFDEIGIHKDIQDDISEKNDDKAVSAILHAHMDRETGKKFLAMHAIFKSLQTIYKNDKEALDKFREIENIHNSFMRSCSKVKETNASDSKSINAMIDATHEMIIDSISCYRMTRLSPAADSKTIKVYTQQLTNYRQTMENITPTNPSPFMAGLKLTAYAIVGALAGFIAGPIIVGKRVVEDMTSEDPNYPWPFVVLYSPLLLVASPFIGAWIGLDYMVRPLLDRERELKSVTQSVGNLFKKISPAVDSDEKMETKPASGKPGTDQP